MNPLIDAFFGFAPYLIAFALGFLIPSKRSGFERVAVGSVVAVSLLLIRALWPGPVVEAEPGTEWKPLLTLIVFLPIGGSLFLLFLPRQAPEMPGWNEPEARRPSPSCTESVRRLQPMSA